MPAFLRRLCKKIASGDVEQEAPRGRRVGLVQRSVHHGPYREIEERKKTEQEESEALDHEAEFREHAPVGQEYESRGGGHEQYARQVVGEGETNQEGREQQVAVGAGVSPDEQYEYDERDE